MAMISKTVVDKDLRDAVFNGILEGDEIFIGKMTKINDRQMGVLLTDLNGETRYVRIGAIVAEIREDMTAEELMQSEIDKYHASVAKQEDKKRKAAEKAAKDKAKREAEAMDKGE